MHERERDVSASSKLVISFIGYACDNIDVPRPWHSSCGNARTVLMVYLTALTCIAHAHTHKHGPVYVWRIKSIRRVYLRVWFFPTYRIWACGRDFLFFLHYFFWPVLLVVVVLVNRVLVWRNITMDVLCEAEELDQLSNGIAISSYIVDV